MGGRRHQVAAIAGAGSAVARHLLEDAVARWREGGATVVGLLEEARGLAGRTCGAGFLRDIATGARHAMYLETVPSDTACHVDAMGAQKAGAAVIGQIIGSDLVVLSKFGKLEAAGGGLVPAFREAMAAGKPVLTTVADLHRAAWQAFAPEAATLAATAGALDGWWAAHR